MNHIEKIKIPIENEMQLFSETFAQTIQTSNPLLLSIYKYLIDEQGKQMRPLLVVLSAKLCGTVNQATIDGAHSLELLHTASLIHDDVVDDTLERRSKPSINAKWGNKIAVFAGNYLFSKSLEVAINTQNILILQSISNIGKQLTDGEILQLDSTLVNSEEGYLAMITKKTANLFESCAEVGGISVNATDKQLEHLRNYGKYLGISFQIKDDIFDYYQEVKIGKPTGNDLRDGKLTLPLIHALKQAKVEEKQQILEWIEQKQFSAEIIHIITDFAHKNGGVSYSIQKMEEYKDRAIAELVGFEDGVVKESLKMFAEYAVLRRI